MPPRPTAAPTASVAPSARTDRRTGGDRTRAQLMDVAEELFAEAGVGAVSIRSINAAAGLAPASVHYHFGDKDGLVRAVIARRGATLVARQTELLDALEGRRRRPTATEAVRLLADPLHDVLAADPVGGARWLVVVADLVAAGDPRVYFGVGPGSTGDRINACAARAYPNQPADLVAARWRLATTALLQLTAAAANRPGGVDDDELEAIVTFVASGLDGVLRRA